MSSEMFLKYGCNPNQKPSRVFIDNAELRSRYLTVIPDILICWTHSTAGSL